MEKWSVVLWVQEFLGQHGLGWLTPQMQILTLACLIACIVKFLVTVCWPAKSGPDAELGRHGKEFFLKVNAMINEAVRRAPPVEAKDPEEGVPFEVYRKDLWRMVDGEISIEEFVDTWRGRKVKKRPTPEELQAMAEQAAKEKAEERPVEEELRTGMGRAFLAEWEAHLENKDPLGFAELFMLNLNEGSEECQRFHSKFVGFMKPRTWDQVVDAIRPAAKNPTPFLTGNAMSFYELFRSKVLREIEAYWNRFLVPKSGHLYQWLEESSNRFPVSKSGHVHQWVRVPMKSSYGGVRFECACGEVQEGIEGNEGVRSAVGTWLSGPTGPYGMTGIGYPTPTGMGMGFVVCGGGGSIESGLTEEVRQLRKEAEEQKDNFFKVNEIIRMMSVELYKVVEKKRENQWNQWNWECVLGQWVRVTRLTSPAFGQFGLVEWVKAGEIRVLVRSKNDDSFLVGLSPGEYEAAYPKDGECWVQNGKHPHPHYFVETNKPIYWTKDLETLHSKERLQKAVVEKCLEPVNYGRGM